MEPHKRNVDQEMADLFRDYEPKLAPKPNDPIKAREREPRLFRIWDIYQKFLLLLNGTLVAAPQNSTSQEQFIAVIPNTALEPNKRPIFIGTYSRDHILTCVKSDNGQPQLRLVKQSIMDLYQKNEASLEFTFYNQTKGSQWTCSFESATFPNWFLSTSPEPNQPLRLSQQGGSDITLFHLERRTASNTE